VLQQPGQRGGLAQRLTEQIALVGIAAQSLQVVVLTGRLHAFCHHGQAQVVGHADGGGANGGVIAVGLQFLDEGAVQLEVVQRQAFQVGQRGVAGAKVVDRQAHAQLANGVQPFDPPSPPTR